MSEHFLLKILRYFAVLEMLHQDFLLSKRNQLLGYNDINYLLGLFQSAGSCFQQ